MDVWLLHREWDDRDPGHERWMEVVGVYASEALARTEAEAECGAVLKAWTETHLSEPPEWLLYGRNMRWFSWREQHPAVAACWWRVSRHSVTTTASTSEPAACPGAPSGDRVHTG